VRDATAVADAGAFALVIEGVVEPIAARITREVACPTIGIGASARCDGQVLVIDDMLGMFERTARFVKRYDDLAPRISAAAQAYASEVRARAFPTDAETYAPR
jgi:3-methyl-2-oxobutanoate hydroxymethyltransferase